MMPGMNSKQMQHMLKQMGVSQKDLDVERVIIETPDKNLVFESPQVQKISMQGQTTFQVIGNYNEEEKEVEVNISDEDVSEVVEQTGVSEDEARKTLEETKGDIAEAIIKLQGE